MRQLMEHARLAFIAGVQAAQPSGLVRAHVRYETSSDRLWICDEPLDLRSRRLHVVGAGKAAGGMAVELTHLLPGRIYGGVVSVPRGASASLAARLAESANIRFREGATNNLPDEDAEATSREIAELARSLTSDDVLLAVISGGGSALLTLPHPELSLRDKQALVRDLARAGADISELNVVRKRASLLKGGRLACLAHPARVRSLILSDIVGDPPHLIASGPTVSDPDPAERAREVLTKYGMLGRFPAELLEAPPPAFPSDPEAVRNYIVGSNRLSAVAASQKASSLGYHSVHVTSEVTGHVTRVAAQYLRLIDLLLDVRNGAVTHEQAMETLDSMEVTRSSAILRDQLATVARAPALCLVLGGEPTVVVRGGGRGGRSQQLALEMSLLLEGWRGERQARVTLLCGGTDGADGPTPAAGAVAADGLAQDARDLGLAPEKYRDECDAYTFFSKYCDGQMSLITGHTGTNVMDLHILLMDFNDCDKAGTRNKL